MNRLSAILSPSPTTGLTFAEERFRSATESAERQHKSAQIKAVQNALDKQREQFDKELQSTLDASETNHREALTIALNT